MLEGLRGEDSIAELCRKEGINQNLNGRYNSTPAPAIPANPHCVLVVLMMSGLPTPMESTSEEASEEAKDQSEHD